MPELNLTSLEDLKKLEGWKILEAKGITGDRPGIVFLMRHPAAEFDIGIIFSISAVLQLSGDTMRAVGHFSIKSNDIKKEEKKQD